MRGGYPPGTTTYDLKRAGIIDDRPECESCGNLIGEGDDHDEDCREYGIDGHELERQYTEAARIHSYEDEP